MKSLTHRPCLDDAIDGSGVDDREEEAEMVDIMMSDEGGGECAGPLRSKSTMLSVRNTMVLCVVRRSHLHLL